MACCVVIEWIDAIKFEYMHIFLSLWRLVWKLYYHGENLCIVICWALLYHVQWEHIVYIFIDWYEHDFMGFELDKKNDPWDFG